MDNETDFKNKENLKKNDDKKEKDDNDLNKEDKLNEINTDKIQSKNILFENEDLLKLNNNLEIDDNEIINFPENLPDFDEMERINEEKRRSDEEKQEIINNLVKQGKYDEVLQFLNIKEKEEDEKDLPLEIIPADDISDLHEDKEEKKNLGENEDIINENKINDINKNEEIMKENNYMNDKKDDDNLKVEEKIDKKDGNNEGNKEIKQDENKDININENKEIKEDKSKDINNNAEKNKENNNEIKKEEKKEENKDKIKEETKDVNKSNENKKEIQKEKNNEQKEKSKIEIKKPEIKNNLSNSSESNSISDLLIDNDDEENYGDLLKSMNILEKIEKENKEENIKENLEILTKELEELEGHEDEDKNNIEQMNELYLMLQEDKNSKTLQIQTREKLFPYYNDTNYLLSDVFKSDLFVNLSMMRNCFISSNIIKLKPIKFGECDKKYEFSYPKSCFDNLEYSSKDLKSEMDYDSYLMEYSNSNFNQNKIKEISNLFSKFKNEKLEIKNTIKKTIEINFENEENNDIDINNKIDNWVKINKNNSNDNNNNEKEIVFKLNDYNKVFLDCFNMKNLNSKEKINNILELNLSKQNLKSFPKEELKKLSQLKFLNLEENQIDKFSDLSCCPDLYSINLNRNLIKKIEGISKLNSLEKLSLNNNLIEKIEGLENNQRLRFLFLGKNKIRNIDSIENQILYIEELILCENQIQSIPEKFSFPYLRFLDLNENNIKNISNFYFCPCLEKLLLKGNNIESGNNKPIFSFLPKLREIDLSFNKIYNLSYLLSILSENLNLEIINIGNNPFVHQCDKFLIKVLLTIFPKLKIINNEDYTQSIYKKKAQKKKIKKLFNCEGYFYIIQLQNFFMKYFNSIYFTNQILNQFNININSNLTEENSPLLNLINTNYFNFKKSHLQKLNDFFNGNFCIFNKHISLQINLLTYLYDFKYKMLYIYNSMGIFSKNLTLRKIKIIKIQQLYKLRIIRKKLAAIVIPDDEYDHADDLLDFFNSKPKEEENLDFKWEEGKIEKIENQIKLRSSQEINKPKKELNKENKENKENQNLTQKKNIVYKLSKQGLETIKEKDNENENLNTKISIDLSQKGELYKNNQSNEEILKLMKNLNTSSKNQKLTPMKITPNPQSHKIYLKSTPTSELISKSNISYNNSNNINSTISNKDILSNINTPQNQFSQINDFGMVKTRYPNLSNYNKGDNIPLKYININNQMGIIPGIISKGNYQQRNFLPPIKRPDSKANTNINNNNFNISTSNISDETKSVKSTFTFNSKFKNVKGRVLPQKVAEEIRRLEQECSETIQKAKAEWGFTNPQTAELLAKKIYKKYRKKISHLLQ